MTLAFPSNPVINQLYQSAEKTWIWLGTRWRPIASASTTSVGNASITVGSNAPASPKEGTLWFNNETGDLYVYSGTGWALSGGEAGAPGATGPAGTVTNAYVWFTG